MIVGTDLVEDVVTRYPALIKVFMSHRFPCLVCGEPVWGTIAENARRNNLSELDLQALLDDLNQLVNPS